MNRFNVKRVMWVLIVSTFILVSLSSCRFFRSGPNNGGNRLRDGSGARGTVSQLANATIAPIAIS